jgi:hypothetical protein
MKALVATVLLCAALAAAQAPPPANKPSSVPAQRKAASSAGRSECAAAVGLCVTVPASWQRLGDVFDDLGFVVAEPHPGVEAANWPQLTVAAIDVPPQKTAGDPHSLDALIDIVLTPDGTFTSSETLQRTHLLLNGADAEVLRVKLYDEAAKTGTIEEVALIEGDEDLVYSIALRCASEDFSRVEPVFQKAIHSWRLKSAAAVPAPPSKPKQDPEKK